MEKKLSDRFAPAAETDKLLRDVKELNQVFFKQATSFWNDDQVACMAGDMITKLCTRIVENQQRQDIRSAAIEDRLAKLETQGTASSPSLRKPGP